MPIGIKTIKRIRRAGKKNTFDLNVPLFHNFFLDNGILTHNSGKTMLNMLVESQLMTVRDRFGDFYKHLDRPHVLLDASGEFSHTKYVKPLSDERLCERLERYTKFFPFIRPVDVSKRTVFYTPVTHMRRLMAMKVYGDKHIGLRGSDFKRLDFQQAFQLILALLNIKEDEPAARMVKRGCAELFKENPSFFDIYANMLHEEMREIKRRKSQTVSRQGQVMLANAICDGDVELGESPDIRRDLMEKKIAVYHFPIKSTGLRTNEVMFSLYITLMLDLVKEGAPAFSFYGEEMHKILQNKNSIFAETFFDMIQLERKSGRIMFAVVRLPEYAGALIDETDFLFTPQLRAQSSAQLLGYTPGMDNYDVENLKVTQTSSGRREANQWLCAKKGLGVFKFFPIPPLTQP